MMSGLAVQVGAGGQCPHGGQMSIISSNTRVLANGSPLATMADSFTVAGCAFTAGTKPQPCVNIQWIVAATRVLVGGSPAVVATGSGLCLSAERIPQGPPSVTSTQTKAVAS